MHRFNSEYNIFIIEKLFFLIFFAQLTFLKTLSHRTFSTLLSKYFQTFFTTSRKMTDKRKNLQLFVDAPADYHSSLAHGSVFENSARRPVQPTHFHDRNCHAVNVCPCIL